jgi:methylmalonyl-CoA/ethylmalonyl-CoA epimerase
MSDTSFEVWHVALPVSNLERSLAYYQILGFQLLGMDETAAKKKAFIVTKPGGFCLELFQANEPSGTPKQPDHIAFECADLSAFRARLIDVLKGDVPEIGEFDNGVKHLRLRDPDGVPLQFFQGRTIFEKSFD